MTVTFYTEEDARRLITIVAELRDRVDKMEEAVRTQLEEMRHEFHRMKAEHKHVMSLSRRFDARTKEGRNRQAVS